MRRLLSPRWLALHALALVLAATCLVLGWWQLQRGQAGNARSFAYALEWPAFAIFVLFMWGRMIYDELRPAARTRAAGGPDTSGASAGAASGNDRRAVPADPADPADDAELAAYNRYLAELNARAERYGR